MNKIIFQTVLIISIVAFFFGCGQSKEMENANLKISESKYQEAIVLLDIEIKNNPENAQAYFLSGKCNLKIGDDDDAYSMFVNSQIIDNSYTDAIGDAYFEYAKKLLNQGSSNDSVYRNFQISLDFINKKNIEKIQDNGTQDSVILENSKRYYEIADLYFNNVNSKFENKEKLLEKDFDYLNKAIEMNPSIYERKSGELYFKLGSLNFGNNEQIDFRQIEFLEKSVEKYPKEFQDLVIDLLYSESKFLDSIGELSLSIALARELFTKYESHSDWFLRQKLKYFRKKSKEVAGGYHWTSNLDVEFFRNGDPINYAETRKEWDSLNYNKTPAYCYYNFDLENKRDGMLYNHYAVISEKGLAPEFFSIPTLEHYSYLIESLCDLKVNTFELGREITRIENIEGGNDGVGYNGIGYPSWTFLQEKIEEDHGFYKRVKWGFNAKTTGYVNYYGKNSSEDIPSTSRFWMSSYEVKVYPNGFKHKQGYYFNLRNWGRSYIDRTIDEQNLGSGYSVRCVSDPFADDFERKEFTKALGIYKDSIF